jgi:hypothetical protein
VGAEKKRGEKGCSGEEIRARAMSEWEYEKRKHLFTIFLLFSLFLISAPSFT